MSRYVTLIIQFCPTFIFTNTLVLTQSIKLGCASAIMILKLKQINNPRDSCRILFSMTAGLPLILPWNVCTMLFTRHKKWAVDVERNSKKVIQHRSTARSPFISQLSGYFGVFSYEFDSSCGSMWAFEGNISLPLIQFLLYSDWHTGSWRQPSHITILPQFKCHGWLIRHSKESSDHIQYLSSFFSTVQSHQSYQTTNMFSMNIKHSMLIKTCQSGKNCVPYKRAQMKY